MKITHYFLYYAYSTRAKNRLHEEFEYFLKALNAKIVTAYEITALKQKIEDKVKSLNAEYYRCSPIEIQFYEHENKIHIHGTNCQFMIIAASLSPVDHLKE